MLGDQPEVVVELVLRRLVCAGHTGEGGLERVFNGLRRQHVRCGWGRSGVGAAEPHGSAEPRRASLGVGSTPLRVLLSAVIFSHSCCNAALRVFRMRFLRGGGWERWFSARALLWFFARALGRSGHVPRFYFLLYLVFVCRPHFSGRRPLSCCALLRCLSPLGSSVSRFSLCGRALILGS